MAFGFFVLVGKITRNEIKVFYLTFIILICNSVFLFPLQSIFGARWTIFLAPTPRSENMSSVAEKKSSLPSEVGTNEKPETDQTFPDII